MMKFMQILMQRAEAMRADESQTATGTYADGVFPLSREHALETRADRMRLSYQRDVTVALRLEDHPVLYG